MNVFCFSGNIAHDIEIKTTSSGKKCCSFSVAINKSAGSSFFITCVAWEKTAELLHQYCKKGDRLSGHGELSTNSWEKDGNKQYRTECTIRSFDFPPKKSSQETVEGQGIDHDDIPF